MIEPDTLSLTIKPEWDEIEEDRTLCRTFLSGHQFEDDIIDAVSMVTSELIANAVQYGAFASATVTIDYRLKVNKKDITVEVKNPVDETVGRHLNRLDEIVQWIRGYQNPFEKRHVSMSLALIRSWRGRCHVRAGAAHDPIKLHPEDSVLRWRNWGVE